MYCSDRRPSCQVKGTTVDENDEGVRTCDEGECDGGGIEGCRVVKGKDEEEDAVCVRGEGVQATDDPAQVQKEEGLEHGEHVAEGWEFEGDGIGFGEGGDGGEE